MIIKSLSRKMPSFGQLTRYMLAPEGSEVCLSHNLPFDATTPEQITQEFTINYELLPTRINGNALYHEIIALEPNTDVPVKKQAEALQNIAQRYLEHRAPDSLAVGVIHFETAHVHMHLMISSNAVLSKKRHWLQTGVFAQIQKEMESYRLRHFPEMGDADHYGRKQEQRKRGNREQHLETRTGKPSYKAELATKLENVFETVRNRKQLKTQLAQLNLTLYQRGRSVGVMTSGGRRYRLKGLGLTEVYTKAETRFELIESRLAMLERGQSPENLELQR